MSPNMIIVVFLRRLNPNNLNKQKTMKRKFFAIMLLTAGLMMTACGNNNQSNNVKPVVDEQKKVEEPQDEGLTGIGGIKKVWAKKSFNMDPGDHTPNIVTYALAFCDTYRQFELNEVLRDYLISGTYDSDQYEIIIDKKNGYIHCMWMVQYTNLTDVCYWNRKDGHQLIAVYMEDSGEGGFHENLVVFYDYANDLVTPEPELTQMIEDRMKKYDAYSVVLPREGKDIQVIGYIFDEENDSADSNELVLKWDGQTFNWNN